jgi:hypothetical protein
VPDYDPACYLCPGNQRVGGDKNPEYKKQYVSRHWRQARGWHGKKTGTVVVDGVGRGRSSKGRAWR